MSENLRGKIFKSGNSLALRLPKVLGLSEGDEMSIVREAQSGFRLEPVDRPKRKFNVAKVAGSATSLEFVEDDDRLFDERPLLDAARPDRG